MTCCGKVPNDNRNASINGSWEGGAQLWNLITNDMKECKESKDSDVFKASVRNWNEPVWAIPW